MTTIYDVAKFCGVSVSTVSRAIGAPEMVRQSTRKRVLEAVESLGYRPSQVARALSTGKTGTLGIVVPDLTNPFFPGVLKGAQAAARASDFYVLVADTLVDPLAEAELIMTMAKQVDGVVVCSPRLADDELATLGKQMRLVCINRYVPGVAAVLMTSGPGVGRAVEHLAALGHRRLAYVNGPARSWSNRERRTGVLAAAARVGVEVVELGPVVPHFDTGLSLAHSVTSLGVTAVVGYNDLVALGIIAGLRLLGVEVPGAISVVGVDDVVMASMSSPPLTTVRMPKEQAGQAAIEVMLRVLGEGGPPTWGEPPLQLEADYLVRASTGPAPARPAPGGPGDGRRLPRRATSKPAR